MVRVYLKSTDTITCQNCQRKNNFGWIYACTVDKENDAATAAAERKKETMVSTNGAMNANASDRKYWVLILLLRTPIKTLN